VIYFLVPREQEFTIRNYLEQWAPEVANLVSILHYEELPGRATLPAGSYLFSALDQLTPGGRRLVRELQRQLRASALVGRVLNDPDAALLRFDLLEELFRQGLNPHRAVRARGDLSALRFPVFLRVELEHTGSLSPLLRTPAELEKALGWAVLQGHSLDELLVVEFCDTADAKGRYRKYSAYVVGSAVISRAMNRGTEWMLKAEGVEFSEEMLLEERAYAFTNPYESQLRRIFTVSGIEFGRIDFAIKDGKVITWEINTNPTIGPGSVNTTPGEWRALRQPMRDHFNRCFYAALQAVDGPVSSQSIAVRYSPDSLREASPIVRPPAARERFGRMRRILGPVGPLLKGMARIMSPWVAWAARRFR
jgi:hypothetical protein